VLDKISPAVSKEISAVPILPTEVNKKEETGLSADDIVDEQKDPLTLPDDFKKVISNLLTPKEEEITLPSLVVSGLIWGGNIPQAIINGKILKEGDTVEGAEILEIKKEGVIIIYKGKEFTIPVVRQVISQIKQLER
jgi:type II secretory pathway component PulC